MHPQKHPLMSHNVSLYSKLYINNNIFLITSISREINRTLSITNIIFSKILLLILLYITITYSMHHLFENTYMNTFIVLERNRNKSETSDS